MILSTSWTIRLFQVALILGAFFHWSYVNALAGIPLAGTAFVSTDSAALAAAAGATGDSAAVLIGAGGVTTGLATTVALEGTTGTAMGWNPIGWGLLGAAALGAAYLAIDGIHSAWVASRPNSADANPDLALVTGTAQSTSVNYWVMNLNNNLFDYYYMPTSQTLCNSGTSCTSANLSASGALLVNRVLSYISSAGFVIVPTSVSGYTYALSSTANPPYLYIPITPYCGATSSYPFQQSSATAPAGMAITNVSCTPTSGGAYIRVAVTSTTNAYECPANSYYNFLSNNCIENSAGTTTASLSDGQCRITRDGNGIPIWNTQDPDCAYFTINVAPPSGTTGATVKITDPGNGKSLTVNYPQYQGVGNGTSIQESVPNQQTGTTTVTTTQLSNPQTPTQIPLTQGTSTSTYQGTNPQQLPNPTSTATPTTTATPIPQVQISNAGPITVTGTVTCTNCTTTQPTGEPTTKIDPEVPANKSSDPTPATFAPITTWLGSVQTRLANFFSFQLPSHQDECPSISFDFNIFNRDAGTITDNNAICSITQSVAPVLATVMQIVFLIAAIFIVLGA
jgi:hypothetical protein